jgi:hypothetical protein
MSRNSSAPRSAYAGLEIAAARADDADSAEWRAMVEEQQFQRLRKALKWGSAPFQLLAAIAVTVCVVVYADHASVRGTLCSQTLNEVTRDPELRCDTHWALGYSLPVPFFVGFIADFLTLTRSDDHRLALSQQNNVRRWGEYSLANLVIFLQLTSLSGLATFIDLATQFALVLCAHAFFSIQTPEDGAEGSFWRLGILPWGVASGAQLVVFGRSFALYATWLQVYVITAVCLLASVPILRAVQARFFTGKSTQAYLKLEFVYLGVALVVRCALVFQLVAALRF